MAETTQAARASDVILIGLNGFGRQHLLNLERLGHLGKVHLIAGIEVNDPGPAVRGEVPVYSTLDQAHHAGHRPDIVIVSTPINTHFELAVQALRMGADVLVEKPPTATMDQYDRLLDEADRCAKSVQVGFQSMGSHALDAIDDLLASGDIGQLRAVGATGLWLRSTAYYQRAPWAGRRRLDGVEVVDGVVTNPLAHAVKTALQIAGARRSGDISWLDTELHHAHRIEADDTSLVRLRTTRGIPVTAALTLCAAHQEDPWITISGTEGQAVLYYTRDELVVTPNPEAPQTQATGADGPRRLHLGRSDLVENLVDVQAGRADHLLSPLEDQGAFMSVLEAVRTADDPTQIPAEYLEYAGSDGQQRPVIPHIADYAARAVAAAPSSFSSVGAPWAATPHSSGMLYTGTGDDAVPVARLRTGADISPTDSPRPFLDEVTTRGGVLISDQQPLDHTWHLGVGVALQDVSGHNFWGGRTYTRAEGRYIWRDDHGRIEIADEHIEPLDSGQRLQQQLNWVGADGHPILNEHRIIQTTTPSGSEHEADHGHSMWELMLRFEIESARAETISLGSPGSHGRPRGGYGGFFWRLPQLSEERIFTAEADGEEAVHGSVTDWLAVAGTFRPLPSRRGHGGEATLLLLRGSAAGSDIHTNAGPSDARPPHTDHPHTRQAPVGQPDRPRRGGEQESTAEGFNNSDPWFIRHASYPGVGMSLAWDTAVSLSPGETVTREVRVVVVDGILSRSDAAYLAQVSMPATAVEGA